MDWLLIYQTFQLSQKLVPWPYLVIVRPRPPTKMIVKLICLECIAVLYIYIRSGNILLYGADGKNESMQDDQDYKAHWTDSRLIYSWSTQWELDHNIRTIQILYTTAQPEGNGCVWVCARACVCRELNCFISILVFLLPYFPFSIPIADNVVVTASTPCRTGRPATTFSVAAGFDAFSFVSVLSFKGKGTRSGHL